MGLSIISAENPQYANAAGTLINLIVLFEGINGPLPFTASPNDTQVHGRELFNQAKRGDFGPVLAYNPPEPVVPHAITAAQGGVALIQAGLMDAVMAVVNSPDFPPVHKWAWERAQEWRRDSAALGFIAEKAGIGPQQMDDLFIAAAALKAI